ncbi:hypothetical protein OS493_012396 [Desmophyllum pertusum]|uniref:CCHC-type domain-containing protein n=1 Tax=Desmophyllum pertusum TaxID=174260 RepID=A0A9W9ZQG4_9CNID|nr:hypothetical protein OS493_012396 [Desmophyllum pertusum]
MSDARQKTCMICGIHGHTLIDCPYRCNFCGESSEACHCLDSSLVKRVIEAETKQTRTKGNRTSEDRSEKKTETNKERGTGSKKTRKTAQTKVSEDLKLQVEGLLEQKERTAELHRKREDELLQTIAAMQSRLEKLEDEMAVGKSNEPSKRKQSKKEESDTRDSEDYSDIAAEEGQSDETADEENGDDLEPTPIKVAMSH